MREVVQIHYMDNNSYSLFENNSEEFDHFHKSTGEKGRVSFSLATLQVTVKVHYFSIK